MTLPASIVKVILSYYLEKVENNTIAKLARYNNQALDKFLEILEYDDVNLIVYKMNLAAKYKIPYKKYKKLYKLYKEITLLNTPYTGFNKILNIIISCVHNIDYFIKSIIKLYKIIPNLFNLYIKNNIYKFIQFTVIIKLHRNIDDIDIDKKRKYIKKLVDAGINMNIYFEFYECHLLSKRMIELLLFGNIRVKNERLKDYISQYSGESIYPFDSPPIII